MPRRYCVYLLASRSRCLYTGVTGHLARRLADHREGAASAFTRQYGVTRLVHVEVYARPADAIAREKQIKGWSRAKKLALVGASNPTWADLTDDVLASLMVR